MILLRYSIHGVGNFSSDLLERTLQAFLLTPVLLTLSLLESLVVSRLKNYQIVRQRGNSYARNDRLALVDLGSKKQKRRHSRLP